jgi:hypothetical protein
MAMNLSESTIPEDYDYKTPDHLIIWLDAYIGDPTKYHQLKKAFSSNIDPRSQTWTMLNDDDYDTLLRTNEAMPVTFGGVLVLLLAFTDSRDCYAAFQKYTDKRILLITSGSEGKKIVPRILEDFQQVFTDLVTNDPYNSVYIFCGDISYNYEWAMDHLYYIQIFNHEADLLLRITRDIAEYYITQGERQNADGHLKEALRFYHWAKKLFLQYEKMGQPSSKNIADINRRTKAIEDILRPPNTDPNFDRNDSDDEGHNCEPCS